MRQNQDQQGSDQVARGWLSRTIWGGLHLIGCRLMHRRKPRWSDAGLNQSCDHCGYVHWNRRAKYAPCHQEVRAQFEIRDDIGCAECAEVARLNENPPIGGRYFCPDHSS